MALRVALRHIDALLAAFPQMRTFYRADIGADLAHALAFLAFCNDSVALFLPASHNVHLRRQLVALRQKTQLSSLRAHLDRQIAILDLEDGVVERAAIAGDARHKVAYAREIEAYDRHCEADPPFLSQTWREIDLTGDVRGQSLLWFIRRNPELCRGKHILHIGPEGSIQAFFRDAAADMRCLYETSDGFSETVGHLEDVSRLTHPDARFDVIICHRVLEHVALDIVALGEFQRVLKPGGMLDISVPQSMNRDETVEWRAQDSSHHDHVRQYVRDFKKRLEAAGFSVAIDHALLTRSSAEHNRDGNYPMRHYICRKNPISSAAA